MIFFTHKTYQPAPSLGSRGEQAAQRYLKKQGYKILETNYCNTRGKRLGEIDIIAKDEDKIVFVEVKTRTLSINPALNVPEENINAAKLYKLNKIATFYLSQHKIQETSYRFDAITILADTAANSAKLRHIKNIFL